MRNALRRSGAKPRSAAIAWSKTRASDSPRGTTGGCLSEVPEPQRQNMTRADKVWDLHTRCVRANDSVLFHDHGRVLKRVFRRPGEVQGTAAPTRLTLADVLKTWEWVYQRTADRRDDDEDA